MVYHTAPLLSPEGLEALCRWGYALVLAGAAGTLWRVSRILDAKMPEIKPRA